LKTLIIEKALIISVKSGHIFSLNFYST